jgi:hypothetical protein
MTGLEQYIRRAKLWFKAIVEQKMDTIEDLTDEFRSITNGEYARWRKSKVENLNVDKGWREIEQRIKFTSISRKSWFLQWQMAASIAVIFIVSAAVYILLQDINKPQDKNVISPGYSMAYLETGVGNQIELSQKDTILMLADSRLQIDSGAVVYGAIGKKNVDYHRISVPRNGEYFVQLSDGTKVWINSASSIGFMSEFTDNVRLVDLEGEAYFEVAKNPDKPFIVKTNHMNVHVLGTHFNIKAYTDDKYSYATLNEGKVRIQISDVVEDIVPNEQMILENKTGLTQRKIVDASIYSAWTKGKFVFKDEKLENILSDLARWYDLDIFYTNQSLKNERFSINVNRYDNIQTLLDHLELIGGINFEINQNALIIK